MSGAWHDCRLFWNQFRENFHTTGAVLPSGRALGKALARFVGPGDAPRCVLEVGPGTGAVTAQIVRRLGPTDSLDLVELNEPFVRRLQQRFAAEADFQRVAARSRVLHQSVETLDGGQRYDVIVSGLPLNNFAVDDVRRILDHLLALLRPGGTLSFFEYIAIRQAKSILSSRQERRRLRGIGQVFEELVAPRRIGRDWVWLNVPPAWVHHVRGGDRGDGI